MVTKCMHQITEDNNDEANKKTEEVRAQLCSNVVNISTPRLMVGLTYRLRVNEDTEFFNNTTNQ